MFRKYRKGSNETHLYALVKLMSPGSSKAHPMSGARYGANQAPDIFGKYWARMAYFDMNHPIAQQFYFREKSRINFNNLEATGSGTSKSREIARRCTLEPTSLRSKAAGGSRPQ
jgi:hypothetical protein